MPAPTTATVTRGVRAGEAPAESPAAPRRPHPGRTLGPPVAARPPLPAVHVREPAISTRRRPPARPTGAPSPGADASTVPVVGAREPCPCGSGKRYKACHGKGSGEARRLVNRPFAGRVDETDWVALREVVPAATAPLRLKDGSPHGTDRDITLSTVLPLAWPALVRADGRVFLGLQVQSRSGDVSRDLAAALEQALEATPGSPVVPTGLPGPGPRLQDLLADDPLDITLHEGFDHWVEGAADPTGEVAASMERANASVVPTAALAGVRSAYWCRMRERSHLRWVLPEDEDALLDAMARLSVSGGLGLGDGTRYVGSFRAHGLLVPVWDLPLEREAEAVEEPAAALRVRLDEALADDRPLTGDERRVRAGLMSRQLTLN